MAPKVGIAPTSPPLQGGANLPQLLGGACARPLSIKIGLVGICELAWLAEPKLGERRLVVPRGNAPRSAAYRAAALLLSYGTVLS
jgi:hypothetical protein